MARAPWLSSVLSHTALPAPGDYAEDPQKPTKRSWLLKLDHTFLSRTILVQPPLHVVLC